MRSRRIGALVFVAVLSGALLAALLAAALPRGDAGASAGDPLTGAVAASGDPRTPTVAPARPQLSGRAAVQLRATGRIHLEARAADPRGGPQWAVRTFAAQQYVERHGGTGLRAMGKPQHCVQLGRLHAARFGWIDATNTFRPVGIGFSGAPTSCDVVGAAATPQIAVATRITDPGAGAARPLQAVVWGMAGTSASVRLDIDGRAVPITGSPDGAVLVPLPASARRSDVRASIRYSSGQRRTLDRSYRGDIRESRSVRVGMVRRLGARMHDLLERMPLPALPRAGGVPRLEYRLPDPNGGLAWGVAAVPAQGGGWCTSGLARVVGERVGQVDYELGTFADALLDHGCDRPRSKLLERRPLDVQYGGFAGFGSFGGDGALSAPIRDARIVRRTLPGQTTIAGVAHPDVVSVTIATPRDVRTLTPSPRAHVFAAVYDGDFPTGRIDISARLAGGRTWRARPFTMP